MAIKKKTSTRTAKTARPKTASSIRGGTNKTAKKRSSQSFAVIALVASVVFMSIGFAAYATTLYIGGGSDGQGANNATVKASKWDIHWAGESGETTGLLTKTTDITSTAGSCTVTRTSGTVITFDITLGEPGDKCVFNVDAVNGGTIDALLTTITMSDITTYANYLDYKVKYDTTTYTGTTALTTPIPLDAGAHKNVEVTVEYKRATAAQLPSSDVTLTLNASFDYVDAATYNQS